MRVDLNNNRATLRRPEDLDTGDVGGRGEWLVDSECMGVAVSDEYGLPELLGMPSETCAKTIKARGLPPAGIPLRISMKEQDDSACIVGLSERLSHPEIVSFVALKMLSDGVLPLLKVVVGARNIEGGKDDALPTPARIFPLAFLLL